MREKLIGIILEVLWPECIRQYILRTGLTEAHLAEAARAHMQAEMTADALIAAGAVQEWVAKSLEEWGEDYGDVLWWTFPIEEPPYVGSPLDERWPGYHTHWTPVLVPAPPKEE